MKSVVKLCVIAIAMTCVALAQEAAQPPLQRGIHVEMAAASHSVQMPAADEKGATVVSITADGKVFVGVNPADVSTLRNLNSGTIYLKADARTQYQKVLAVLDALHGRSLVLLTAPPSANAASGKMVPPYGMKLTLGGQ